MKKNTKQHILKSSEYLILEKGYNALGLQAILNNADVPKGSFYYYFKSKEDFTFQLMEDYNQRELEIFKSFLTDKSFTPKDRVKAYFYEKKSQLERVNYKNGDLIVNLSIELANQNERFESFFKEVDQEWNEVLKKCLEEAHKYQQIKETYNLESLSKLLINSWNGALLKVRVLKNENSIDSFIENLNFIFENSLEEISGQPEPINLFSEINQEEEALREKKNQEAKKILKAKKESEDLEDLEKESEKNVEIKQESEDLAYLIKQEKVILKTKQESEDLESLKQKEKLILKAKQESEDLADLEKEEKPKKKEKKKSKHLESLKQESKNLEELEQEEKTKKIGKKKSKELVNLKKEEKSKKKKSKELVLSEKKEESKKKNKKESKIKKEDKPKKKSKKKKTKK